MCSSFLKLFLNKQVSLTDAVETAYDKCDIQFLALLQEKTAAATAADDSEQLSALVAVADEVNAAMQRRMSAATTKLQQLLTAGSPSAIEV
jgi:hypothetical protein